MADPGSWTETSPFGNNYAAGDNVAPCLRAGVQVTRATANVLEHAKVVGDTVLRGFGRGLLDIFVMKVVLKGLPIPPTLATRIAQAGYFGTVFVESDGRQWTPSEMLENSARFLTAAGVSGAMAAKTGSVGAGAAKGGVSTSAEPSPQETAGGDPAAEEPSAGGPRASVPEGPASRTPATIDPSMNLARPPEQLTAQRLAQEYPEFDGRKFNGVPRPDPGYDWTDDLGRTYDAMGDGTKSSYFKIKEFEASIDKHLGKGNDFTVIDATGYTPEQNAMIKSYVDGLPQAMQDSIRRIGF